MPRTNAHVHGVVAWLRVARRARHILNIRKHRRRVSVATALATRTKARNRRFAGANLYIMVALGIGTSTEYCSDRPPAIPSHSSSRELRRVQLRTGVFEMPTSVHRSIASNLRARIATKDTDGTRGRYARVRRSGRHPARPGTRMGSRVRPVVVVESTRGRLPRHRSRGTRRHEGRSRGRMKWTIVRC